MIIFLQIIDLNQIQIVFFFNVAQCWQEDQSKYLHVSLIITLKEDIFYPQEVGQSDDPTERVLKQLFNA